MNEKRVREIAELIMRVWRYQVGMDAMPDEPEFQWACAAAIRAKVAK